MYRGFIEDIQRIYIGLIEDIYYLYISSVYSLTYILCRGMSTLFFKFTWHSKILCQVNFKKFIDIP